MQLVHWAAIFSLLAYLLASAGYTLSFWRPAASRFRRLGRISFLLALALHSIIVVALALNENTRSLSWSGDYYLWLSWVLALLHAFSQRKLQYPIIGAFIAPLVALLMASSSYLAHRGSEVAEAPALFFLSIHVIPAVIAEANLLLAFVASLVFLMQERRLKAKSRDFAFGGPSLDSLDSVSSRCTQIGFLAMTAAVISGVFWTLSESRSLLRADYLQWSALGTWVLLALLMHLRLTLRWSRRKLSVLTVATVSILFTTLIYLILSQGSAVHGAL